MSTTHTPTWTLGNRLAKARDDAGLTTYQLADLLGVSRTTVTNWENDTGKLPPKRYAIEAWARACNVEVCWLETGLSEDQMAEVERLGAHPGEVVVVPNELHAQVGHRAQRSRWSAPYEQPPLPGLGCGVWVGAAPVLSRTVVEMAAAA